MSSLSLASKSRFRKIPQALRKLSNGCSISKTASTENVQRINHIATRHKSSNASFADYFMSDSVKESVQESVKTSILDRVTRDESKVWTSGAYSNGHTNGANGNSHNTDSNGVNEEISAWHHDPLDDLPSFRAHQ